MGDVLAGILGRRSGGARPSCACAARVTVVDTPGDATAGLPASSSACVPPPGCGSRPSTHPGPRPSSARHRTRGRRRQAPPTPSMPAARRHRWRHRAGHPRPARRGVHDHVVLEVATAAPFGLLWWRNDRGRGRSPAPCTSGPRLGRAPAPARRARRHAPAGRPTRSRPHRRAPRRAALPARGPPALGALAGHRPQRRAHGARDGGADGRARHLRGRGCPPTPTPPSAWPSGPWPRWWRSSTGAPRCCSPPPRRTGRRTGRRGRPPQRRAAPGPGRGRAGADRGPRADDDPRTEPRSSGELLERRQAGQPAGPARALDRLAGGVRRRGGHRHRRVPGRGRAVVGASQSARSCSWSCGMVLSYRTRARPLPAGSSRMLAAGAVAAFVWFFRQLTGQAIYDVSTVEDPLAVLFVWVQVAHAFDVPARRDLAFSLAGSASLMAVAAAQAIDLAFGVYVAGLARLRPGGLLAMWSSASEGGRLRGRAALLATLAAVVVAGAAVLVVLPAPHVAGRIDFPANGRARRAAARPRRPGRRRQGGPAGQAGQSGRRAPGSAATWASPTASTRPCAATLGNTVVMRVRAQRPSYWIGETFDTGTAPSWSAPDTHSSHRLDSGSPFLLPPAPIAGGPAGGADRPADLLHRAVVTQPGVPRRQRRRGVVPGPRPLHLRQRHHRLPHRPRARRHLHGASPT